MLTTTKLTLGRYELPLGMPLYLYFVVLVLLGLTYLPLFFSEPIVDAFAREDRIFESLSAVYLFLASAAFALAYYRSRQPPHNNAHSLLKQLSYLGLALFFFVAAGEEISWGQRILGIETPEAIKEINYQDELTLHNLNAFQGEDSVLPVNLSQLFIAFGFAFGIGVPLVALLFEPARRFFNSFMPIVPLALGLFFAANYVYQKLILNFLRQFPDFYLHPTMPTAQGVYEIREHGYAFVFMLLAFYVGFVMLKSGKQEGSNA
ncbi:MAG: hypothetical protein AAF614_43180 [Chloroflexota bacterium]